jgi:prolyl oligopeptidase
MKIHLFFFLSSFINKIRDPYRWLEDPNSAETKAFIKAQNDITIPYIESCPYRQQIRERFQMKSILF